MKEWAVRLLCVALGSSITLGTTKVQEYVETTRLQDDIVAVEVIEEAKEALLEEIEANEEFDDEVIDVETVKKVVEEVLEEVATASEETSDTQVTASGKMTDALSENEHETQEETIKLSGIDAAPVKWIKDYPLLNAESTLEDKQSVRTSYEETMAVNAFDKSVIENSTVDFSDVKITIVGDSITEGSNLSEEEKALYNWPTQLQEILGCKEVVNLGIGGSTISQCVDHYPMCQRWKDIAADSDIIIVMGGSNDMLFEDRARFGSLDEEGRATRGTFCGDLDHMLAQMCWVYRICNEDSYSKLIYINPPSTILNDGVYATDPVNMVQQGEFADAINTIATSYLFEVVDMYNNNILNSHDPDINANFVYDGIHCNKEGYRIIAEHMASQIIQRIEQ